jgi:DNA polymerase-1
MRYLLYDGYNLCFRAFFGMPELRRSDGLLTNAVHGWVRTLWMLKDQEAPDREIAIFDMGVSTRTDLLPDYKANRQETPAEFEAQMPYVRKITEAMGIAVVEEDRVEADDLMASLAIRMKEAGHEVILVSADKDLGQVVQTDIIQLIPPPTANPRTGWKRLDAAGIEARFGVRPALIPDYLALIGDSSDNIPGIKGVGPKTAAKWLREYGGLEAVIASANYLQPARFQGVVAKEADKLRRNYKVTTLDLDCARDFELPPDPRPDRAKLRELFDELEMAKAGTDAETRYAGG